MSRTDRSLFLSQEPSFAGKNEVAAALKLWFAVHHIHDISAKLKAARTAWLKKAAIPLSEWITQRTGLVVPPNTTIEAGWLTRTESGRTVPNWDLIERGAVGTTTPVDKSPDHVPHVHIHPTIVDHAVGLPDGALDVLLHELIHTTQVFNVGHNAVFEHAARSCGLQGPPTATYASPDLMVKFNRMVDHDLGEYPNPTISLDIH